MRHPFRRLVTALWACWFLLLVSEPAMLHACPMHDAVASAAPAAAAVAGSDDAGDLHAGHGSHAGHAGVTANPTTAAGSATDGQSSHEDGHACSCLGDCATSAPVVRTEPQRWGWLAGVVRLERPLEGATLARPARVDHALPFANGPPTPTRA